MKNNRGDIPITILVIGIVAVCGLAIFSFYAAGERFKGSFASVQVIEKANSFSEEMQFYKNMNKAPSSEMTIFKKDWVMGSNMQNITFGIKDNFIEGTLKGGGKRILFVRYEFAN